MGIDAKGGEKSWRSWRSDLGGTHDVYSLRCHYAWFILNTMCWTSWIACLSFPLHEIVGWTWTWFVICVSELCWTMLPCFYLETLWLFKFLWYFEVVLTMLSLNYILSCIFVCLDVHFVGKFHQNVIFKDMCLGSHSNLYAHIKREFSLLIELG